MTQRCGRAARARHRAEQIRSYTTRHDDCGAFTFLPGEPTCIHHMILEGHIERGPMLSSPVLGSGDLIGALPTLWRPAYPGSAAALCRPIVLAIPAWGFEQVLRDQPRVAINLLTAAAEVFQDAHARLGEAWRLPVEQRMARTLWRLMRRSGYPCNEGITLDLVLTHRDLASVSGTTQCAVSRALES